MSQIIFEYARNVRFTNDLKADVCNLLTTYGYDHVYKHCLNVAEEAIRLADEFGEDTEKAKIAGLLHDISMIIPNDIRIERAVSLKIDTLPEEKAFPILLHHKKEKIFIAGVVGNGNETCKLWNDFSQLDKNNPLSNKINENGYEIRVYSEDGKCECHVGVSVKDADIPDAYTIYPLAPSRYAVFNIYPSQGYESQNEAIHEWLNANAGKYKQTYTDGKSFSILVYDDRYKGEKDPSSVVEIWIPIEEIL